MTPDAQDDAARALPEVRSLFDAGGEGETIDVVASGGAFRLEFIVSRGAASPDGFWYDQDNPEWVVLVRGAAVLEFRVGRLALRAGDGLLIPAHLEHRVAETSVDAVWLAAHFAADTGGRSA